MAILKLIRDEYVNQDAMYNLVHYVLNANKMPSRCFGGTGISLTSPADSMYKIKNVYDKTTGKQAEQFVLAFNYKESRLLNSYFIEQIAYEVCKYFEGVQVLFALHETGNTYISDDYGDNNVHIHFVVNTVNMFTGNKFWLDYNNAFALKAYIQSVLYTYQISKTVRLVWGENYSSIEKSEEYTGIVCR